LFQGVQLRDPGLRLEIGDGMDVLMGGDGMGFDFRGRGGGLDVAVHLSRFDERLF
jgi:hypothetical protein